MPRYANDGMIKATWVPSVSDKTAPTVTELGAGEDLECHLTKDGLGITFNENAVEDGALCEVFDAQLPGSYSVQISLTLKRNSTEADDPWTFFSRGDTGYLVVRRGAPSSQAYAGGDRVEVYPVIAGQKAPVTPASNEQARMTVSFYGTEEPELDATVSS